MDMFDYEKEHLDILRSRLGECCVLLKKDGVFPLPAACNIAAFGNGVRHTVKGGTGSGEVNSRFTITAEQGLKNAGFTIVTDSWLDAYDSIRIKAHKQFLKRIKREAHKAHTPAVLYSMGAVMPEPEYELSTDIVSDTAGGECNTCIYVLARNSGEGSDRKDIAGDFRLTESEIRDILKLNDYYPRFMLVLNVGAPVDLAPVKDVKNILLLSQLGALTGTALSDILLGRTVPSGKLADTWSSMEDYCPDIDFGNSDDTSYNEGIYVGYRYFDKTGKKALFPFGFGLSYTEFSFKDTKVTIGDRPDKVVVNASVTNTGSFPGREVMQVYVSCPEGSLDKPYQDLAAFSKTSLLAPGASEDISAVFCLSDLASYDTVQSAYILEKGRYYIRAGVSSTDTRICAAIDIDDDIVVRKVRPVTDEGDHKDRVYIYPDELKQADSEGADGVIKLHLSADQIPVETVEYDKKGSVLREVHHLPLSALISMAAGDFSAGGFAASVIGNASGSVPGAAGETTTVLRSSGIKSLVMADGPAGLRLAPEYYRDSSGAHSLSGSSLPSGMDELIFGPLRLLKKIITGRKQKVPAGAEIQYQYATAIPIASAVSQSWNRNLAYLLGDIVGDEMERMGVHLWLAPAMNIHRSVLCGRNFEYFSEDPLISGLMAASITRGVQKHSGRGTVIKHFAANNQELNRSHNNSRVSERALREIYLKGFAICARQAQPAAVMTSYNLINGIHTSESRSLIMDFLRSENQFKGIVMTDWVVRIPFGEGKHRYRNADAGQVALAGGELFMPGSQADHNTISKALAEGTISRRQLEENASRLLSLIRKLTD